MADYEWQPSEVLILGGGSNFLFTEDFTGTVFYPAMQGKEVIKEDEEEVWVRIGATKARSASSSSLSTKYLHLTSKANVLYGFKQ